LNASGKLKGAPTKSFRSDASRQKSILLPHAP